MVYPKFEMVGFIDFAEQIMNLTPQLRSELVDTKGEN
jgi:hypothetical protein